MTELEISKEIVTALGFNYNDIAIKKYGKRHSTNWVDLVYAFIINGSIKDTATYLGYTEASLEHYMHRHISPLFKDTPYKGKWRSTFLRFIGCKSCTKCNTIKLANDFGNDETKFDGLRSFCLRCSNTYKKHYGLLNQEAIKSYRRTSYIKNTAYYIAKNAKRRATKLKATPNWANLVTIKEIYQTCPEGYHVDHIVPLQNPLVCGLHCEFNLQQLPARENLSKGNRFK